VLTSPAIQMESGQAPLVSVRIQSSIFIALNNMKSGSILIHLLRIRCLLAGFIILFFLHAALPARSQSVRYILTKDGLPQSFVSGLVQDDTSFIWIGTRNGLARYDGIQFKVFQHSARDSSTLASNLIIWVRKDKQNQLWIEYESGEIDEMNPVTEKVRHLIKESQTGDGTLQYIRRGWLVDEQGIFWGIRKGAGINNFDPLTKRTERFNRYSSGFASDTILGLAEIRNRGICFVGLKELGMYDQQTKKFSYWPIPFLQDYGDFSGMDAIAIDLHERKNGELMWGDRKNIYFFNPSTHAFRSISLPVEAYLGIRWIRTGEDGYEYFENYGRVFRYLDKTGASSIGKTANEIFSDAKSFLVDRSGLIWLGTNATGIQQIDLEIPFFQSYTYKKDFITDMLREELGISMQETFGWTPKDQEFSQPSYYFRSVNDANNKLYLALKQTVGYYDSAEKKFIKLPKVPIIDAAEKMQVGIRGITIMPGGAPLVVGYSGNIMYYDFVTRHWMPFIQPDLLRNFFGPSLLPLDILADEKNLWITTEKDGLLKIDIATKQISRLKVGSGAGSLPSNQLLGLRADPLHTDILWIGSYLGLIRLDKKNMKCEVFSLKEGLPDNTIYGILPDQSGNLWLSTNKGICRFDPETHSVRAYHTIHGLPGDEFNRFHQMTLPDGRLTFGSTDGWTIFNPLRIKIDNFQPALAFTDLKINNKDVSQNSENSPLHLPINALSQLTLPYEQNTLTFNFAGLEFSQPQDIQYRYRLQGYDNDWVLAGNAHQANYTKIPPGNYTLYVNASNTSGKWSSHVKKLKLRIESPWYSTKMAYLCYCIILAGLTWTFIRFRVSRIVMQEEIVLKEREAAQLKELDDMKSKFFSNITHEFRTPLTLIMGPAEQLKRTHADDPGQSKLADTIVNNAKQLLILINRLMDLSKLEAKALKLQEQRGNPADAVGSVVHSFETDAASKQVQLSFENEILVMDCWFYADALERIVYNLVSNALKFTLRGGHVEIILSERNDSMLLVVKDNGIGIEENKLPYIFDRFYQADRNSGLSKEAWDQGTGIGLSLVKELITQMDGEIEVESRVSKNGQNPPGTIFTLTIPYRLTEHGKIYSTADSEQENAIDKESEESEKLPQLLLVEDSVELSGFIVSILSETYRVTHVVNGSLGLQTALSMMPDLILSDVMMPVMDGYEMCSRLKEDIRTSHIPVILLTAKATQENLITGLSTGADDYLTKPFHPTELLLRIHNLLARQQKLRDRIRIELALPVGTTIETEPLPQDIFITRLYEVLDEHLDEELFGVDQLVGVMNMSRSSLHRKLKALTGMSTSEVVRNYRLKKASFLLKEGFGSSDAAYKTGFGSPAYFSKCFREVYGLTPSEFVISLKPKA
jgi:signal transduction histidine kinase/CheY-like chemotaxis protein/AraC-like DNA-binding protein/streptogramin lyase